MKVFLKSSSLTENSFSHSYWPWCLSFGKELPFWPIYTFAWIVHLLFPPSTLLYKTRSFLPYNLLDYLDAFRSGGLCLFPWYRAEFGCQSSTVPAAPVTKFFVLHLVNGQDHLMLSADPEFDDHRTSLWKAFIHFVTFKPESPKARFCSYLNAFLNILILPISGRRMCMFTFCLGCLISASEPSWRILSLRAKFQRPLLRMSDGIIVARSVSLAKMRKDHSSKPWGMAISIGLYRAQSDVFCVRVISNARRRWDSKGRVNRAVFHGQ